MFALAQCETPGFFSHESMRAQAIALFLMSAIAERLFLGMTAGAEEIFFSFFEVDHHGFFGKNMRFGCFVCHGGFL